MSGHFQVALDQVCEAAVCGFGPVTSFARYHSLHHLASFNGYYQWVVESFLVWNSCEQCCYKHLTSEVSLSPDSWQRNSIGGTWGHTYHQLSLFTAKPFPWGWNKSHPQKLWLEEAEALLYPSGQCLLSDLTEPIKVPSHCPASLKFLSLQKVSRESASYKCSSEDGV